jgi:integrase
LIGAGGEFFNPELLTPWPRPDLILLNYLDKESEVVFIPQKVADRLRDYIKEKGIEPEQRIFPITYNAARVMVNKAGKAIGIHLRPHDLKRFCTTYASRAGTPIEIISIAAPARPSFDHSEILGKNQRYRSSKMD